MKTIRFVNATTWPAVYQVGDVAAFEPAIAYRLIQLGVAVDHARDTAGPGGTPLVGAFMAGKTGVPFTYVPSLPGSDFQDFSGAAATSVPAGFSFLVGADGVQLTGADGTLLYGSP